MNGKTKYIIVGGTPIVFPDWISHDEMAHMCKTLGEVTSAGFVNVRPKDDCTVDALPYGKSVSLGVVSQQEDEDKLYHLFNPY